MSSRVGTTTLFTQTKTIEMPENNVFVNKFGHDVCIILVARHLHQFEVLPPHPLLDPQIRHGQVSNTTQAAAAAYPNCRSAVTEHIEAT